MTSVPTTDQILDDAAKKAAFRVTIPNAKTKLPTGDPDDPNHTFASFLSYLVLAPAKEGMTLDEMAERFDLAEALDLAEDVIELSKKQQKLLRKVWWAQSWQVPHKDLLAMREAIGKDEP